MSSAARSGLSRKAAVKAILTQPRIFIKNLRFQSIFRCLALRPDRSLGIESANPTIIKSIKQRDLLNTWLRLYARDRRIPSMEEYQPSRLSDEVPDSVT